jgi:hypothetical protein
MVARIMDAKIMDARIMVARMDARSVRARRGRIDPHGRSGPPRRSRSSTRRARAVPSRNLTQRKETPRIFRRSCSDQ